MTLQAYFRGGTLVEYGLIIGLFAILTMGALQLLGGSVRDNLGSVKRSEGVLINLASLNFGGESEVSTAVAGSVQSGGSVILKGAGYYQVIVDPVTGMPTLKLTDSNTGEVTNATSVEGAQWNSLGHLRLALTLEALAKEQENPEHADYLMKLAEKAYYLGVAEGEIDHVSGLNLGDLYNRVDAFHDLGRLQGDIAALMSNPPADLSPQVIAQAVPLVADVHNIAQSYINALSMMGGPHTDFLIQGESWVAGSGTPGVTLNNLDKIQTFELEPALHGMTAEESIALSQVRQVTQTLLADNKVESPLVEATLTDAVKLDQASSTGSSSTQSQI